MNTFLNDIENVENRNDFAKEFGSKLGVNIRTYKECCVEASKQADPRDLYKGLWYEGELCALYADTNVGKSILAVQIAEYVARLGIRVMYVDMELSDKGVEKRSRTEDGQIYNFSDNLLRITFDNEKFTEVYGEIDDDGQNILEAIAAAGRTAGVQAVIIDNITAICAGVETGEAAVRLVKTLLNIRNENKWSVLFLAHTSKLDKSQPITRDSMAGSKRLISLIDSAFVIGECLNDPSLRYIKQTKVRLDECRYHAGNVLKCRIERIDGLLSFKILDTTTEAEMLNPLCLQKRLKR